MNNKGFTLIELMVVVAIIGILGAIGYPSYDSYMKKSRRSDAKVGLERVADRQERWYLKWDTYTTDMSLPVLGGPNTKDNYYVLSVDSADTIWFALTATAVAGGPQSNDTTTNDGDCRVMKLDSAGRKSPPDCW